MLFSALIFFQYLSYKFKSSSNAITASQPFTYLHNDDAAWPPVITLYSAIEYPPFLGPLFEGFSILSEELGPANPVKAVPDNISTFNPLSDRYPHCSLFASIPHLAQRPRLAPAESFLLCFSAHILVAARSRTPAPPIGTASGASGHQWAPLRARAIPGGFPRAYWRAQVSDR